MDSTSTGISGTSINNSTMNEGSIGNTFTSNSNTGTSIVGQTLRVKYVNGSTGMNVVSMDVVGSSISNANIILF